MEMLQNNREIGLHIRGHSPKRRPQSISGLYKKLKQNQSEVELWRLLKLQRRALHPLINYRHKQGSGLHLLKNHDDTSLMR